MKLFWNNSTKHQSCWNPKSVWKYFNFDQCQSKEFIGLQNKLKHTFEWVMIVVFMLAMENRVAERTTMIPKIEWKRPLCCASLSASCATSTLEAFSQKQLYQALVHCIVHSYVSSVGRGQLLFRSGSQNFHHHIFCKMWDLGPACQFQEGSLLRF